MRKRIVGTESGDAADAGGWLDLEALAQVELTSEAPDGPIEAALRPGSGSGWRAGAPGAQTIRLIFDRPQLLRRIQLAFHEAVHQRSQEFVLRWSPDGGRTFQDLLRQQYTFSPPGTTRQVEDYTVNLAGVTVLLLEIIPDIGGGSAHASLASLRLA
jgi:hypothetical protein